MIRGVKELSYKDSLKEVVQPGEQKAIRRIYKGFSVLKGGL